MSLIRRILKQHLFTITSRKTFFGFQKCIRWQFMTEDADIGFHVYCMNGNDKVDVFPWERVSSHVAMEEGMTVCMRADTRRFISNIVLSTYYNDCLADYVEFDNSYSYLKSKKLWFTVAVEPPLQSEIE